MSTGSSLNKSKKSYEKKYWYQGGGCTVHCSEVNSEFSEVKDEFKEEECRSCVHGSGKSSAEKNDGKEKHSSLSIYATSTPKHQNSALKNDNTSVKQVANEFEDGNNFGEASKDNWEYVPSVGNKKCRLAANIHLPNHSNDNKGGVKISTGISTDTSSQYPEISLPQKTENESPMRKGKNIRKSESNTNTEDFKPIRDQSCYRNVGSSGNKIYRLKNPSTDPKGQAHMDIFTEEGSFFKDVQEIIGLFESRASYTSPYRTAGKSESKNNGTCFPSCNGNSHYSGTGIRDNMSSFRSFDTPSINRETLKSRQESTFSNVTLASSYPLQKTKSRRNGDVSYSKWNPVIYSSPEGIYGSTGPFYHSKTSGSRTKMENFWNECIKAGNNSAGERNNSSINHDCACRFDLSPMDTKAFSRQTASAEHCNIGNECNMKPTINRRKTQKLKNIYTSCQCADIAAPVQNKVKATSSNTGFGECRLAQKTPTRQGNTFNRSGTECKPDVTFMDSEKQELFCGGKVSFMVNLFESQHSISDPISKHNDSSSISVPNSVQYLINVFEMSGEKDKKERSEFAERDANESHFPRNLSIVQKWRRPEAPETNCNFKKPSKTDRFADFHNRFCFASSGVILILMLYIYLQNYH